ncbi:MAG: transposase [Candidatus Saccharimonadaceae bacterium]
MGAGELDNKEVSSVENGFYENEQSRSEVLINLKNRGLKIRPKLASFRLLECLTQSLWETKQQRCWMHKTGNILNKLPKTLHSRAKQHFHHIWMAETKGDAEKCFDFFANAYQVKYPKASEWLAKNRHALLAFYDFP